MQIGVIGQTHGDLESIREAAKQMRRLNVSAIFHLGVNFSDAEILGQHGMPVLKVPGVEEPAYRDPAIANRRIELINEIRILLTNWPKRHPNDLPEDPDPVDLCFSGQIDIVCHGGVYPWIEKLGHVVFISPGTLARRDDSPSPTFAVLDVRPEKIKVSIYDLGTGGAKRRKSFPIVRHLGTD